MSEPKPASDRHDNLDSHIVAHVRNSLRKNLGELSDEILETKKELVRKIRAQICTTNDLSVLRELNSFLCDVLLSDEDVTKINARITSIVDAIKTNAISWRELKREIAPGNK